MKRFPASLVALPLVLAACGQGTPFTPTQNLTGTWNGVFAAPTGAFVDTPFQMTLTQNGYVVTGTVDVPINGVNGALERYGEVGGSITRDTASLNFVGTGDYAGGRATITVKVNGNQLGGTGQVVYGSSERKPSPTANVTATRQ